MSFYHFGYDRRELNPIKYEPFLSSLLLLWEIYSAQDVWFIYLCDWCSMPYSRIYHLYHGGQQCGWRKPHLSTYGRGGNQPELGLNEQRPHLWETPGSSTTRSSTEPRRTTSLEWMAHVGVVRASWYLVRRALVNHYAGRRTYKWDTPKYGVNRQSSNGQKIRE